MTVEWLCTRCAEKEDKRPEDVEPILRLCTSCKVKQWVRPFGHAGEQATETPEEIQAAVENQIAEAARGRERIEKIKADRIATIAKATEEVVAETISEPEIVEVLKEAPTREEERAALLARLAELEGE
jgi:hypothetical protein